MATRPEQLYENDFYAWTRDQAQAQCARARQESLDDRHAEARVARGRTGRGEHQVARLRRLKATRPNVELDLDHLIEEVEGLGKSERDAVRSAVRRIMEHCLKLEYSPAREPRAGWHETVMRARTDLEDKLTPTLRRSLQRGLPRLYEQGRRDTAGSLRFYGEPDAADLLLPECPWRLAALLRHDWHPPSRHGLKP